MIDKLYTEEGCFIHDRPRKRKKHNGAPLLVLAVTLFLAGMTAFFIPFLTTKMEIAQDAEEYVACREQFADIIEPITTVMAANPISPISESASAALPSPTVSSLPEPEQGNTGVDLSACLAANVDFIGWLRIPDTTVDYPVVQTDDTDYYLNHTFTGKQSYIGTLFSLGKTDFHTPSRNIAIYGHHIRSNDQVMFSPLLDYKVEAFYAAHDTIYFDTLYHAGTYKIFAVLNMHNGDWEPSTADFASEDTFLAFVWQTKSQSLYDTGITVLATDHILTLITCDRSYGGRDGRLLVMAVQQ
ncbi:MAG: class B sortase [Eubacteriales bacterium]|nr:class B sortase [Eubacteriales bacterium]